MDGNRFDRIVRLAIDRRSRRGVLRLALGGALGGSALAANEVAGKHHKCKAKKGKKRCNGVCISILADPANCGDCGVACDVGQNCVAGLCVGGGGGGLPIETICDPATDVCQAGLQCDSPTTRHTCSSTVEGIDAWCCLPRGAACTKECDCCGDNYCHFDDNNQGHCICNPEGGNCNGGACNGDDDCNGNTPNCCGGTCVDLLGDANNCGDCGHQCDAGQVCGAGVCGDALAPARHDRRSPRAHGASGRQRHGQA